MNLLEKHLESEQLRKNHLWKALKPHSRFMICMYFYRLLTDPDNMESYIETHRFRQLNIFPGDLPDFILKSKPEQLRAEANEHITKFENHGTGIRPNISMQDIRQRVLGEKEYG